MVSRFPLGIYNTRSTQLLTCSYSAYIVGKWGLANFLGLSAIWKYMGLFAHFRGCALSTSSQFRNIPTSEGWTLPNQAWPRAIWSSFHVSPALKRMLGSTLPKVPLKLHPSPFCESLVVLKSEFSRKLNAKANGGLLVSTRRWVLRFLSLEKQQYVALHYLSH